MGSSLRQWLLSNAGHTLYDALVNRPDQFKVAKHTVIHIPSGISFWTSNGPWFFDGTEEAKNTLGILERHYLYWVFRRQRNRSIAKRLERS